MSESLTNEELEDELHDYYLNKDNMERIELVFSMARRTLSAEERLEKALDALKEAEAGLEFTGAESMKDVGTFVKSPKKALLFVRGVLSELGTPKELRIPAQVTPPVAADVVPINAFLKLRAADQIAKIIDEMVDADTLNSRSRLADARLDYGQPHQYEHLKA
jgi:hypothetical protein